MTLTTTRKDTSPTMYAVILAGGVGTRLWPRSRQSHPKQFTDITGSGRTLIQATVDRLAGLVPPERVYVITGAAYTELTREQLPELPRENILVEPEGKNTAPAIGLACAHLHRRDPEAVAAFLPADHVVQDTRAFQTALASAVQAAEAGYLVTLGIEPRSPHTGYGYIKRDERLDIPAPLPVYRVERFLEKPDLETARRFLADGRYFWNGGIFVTQVETMLGEMARQLPQLHANLRRIEEALGSPEAEQVLAEVWPGMPTVSIDYGVMEQAQQVAVVPLDAGWNDVGSWDALEEVIRKDGNGNCLVSGEQLGLDIRGNIIVGDKRFIALIGIEDLVVVDTEDALLIGRKSEMQRVKEVVEQLRAMGRDELL